jgi:hypothetical protein
MPKDSENLATIIKDPNKLLNFILLSFNLFFSFSKFLSGINYLVIIMSKTLKSLTNDSILYQQK